MKQESWTPKEIEELKTLRKGRGPTEIGKLLNRSRDSVRHKLRWLKEKGIAEAPGGPVSAPEGKWTHPFQAPIATAPKPKVRKGTTSEHGSLEWCQTCGAPVSNWGEHTMRIGCQRPLQQAAAIAQ